MPKYKKRGNYWGYTKASAPKRVTKATKAYVKKAVRAGKQKGYSDNSNTLNPSTDGGSQVVLLATPNDSIEVGQEDAVEGLKMKYTYIEGTVRIKANADTANHHIRVMMVYDKKPAGAIWAPTDLLETQESNSLLAADQITHSRFNVCYDRSVILGGSASTTNIPNEVLFKVKKRLTGLPMARFVTTGASGDVSGFEQGSLAILALSDTADASTAVQCLCELRIHYEFD